MMLGVFVLLLVTNQNTAWILFFADIDLIH